MSLPLEIERKFLVDMALWREARDASIAVNAITQCYLVASKRLSVRVRLASGGAWLTFKGPTRGATRRELEMRIPLWCARLAIRSFGRKRRIEKTRYTVDHAGRAWVVDEFGGPHAGLVLAEIELTHEDEAFERPAWAGEEVTHDARYYNVNLSLGAGDAGPSGV